MHKYAQFCPPGRTGRAARPGRSPSRRSESMAGTRTRSDKIMMAWFSVRVQARAPEGAPQVPHAVIDNGTDRLMDLLAEHDGIVSGDDRQWSATIGLEQPDPARAAVAGAALVEKLAAKAGMPPWPAVRVEAVREDLLE